MLFEPFLELKMKQNFENVNDYNIGMGLTCSQAIVRQMGGDITIKQSNRGLTVFAFKIPVQPGISQISLKQQQSINMKSIRNIKSITSPHIGPENGKL